MSRQYIRRRDERTLLIRRSVQVAFLLLNVWIGVRFYQWVRHFETAGATIYVPRPSGVEGWLPIAALMKLKYLAVSGTVPEVHPAGLFLIVAFLAISLLFRKAFCSWLCPIGTLSEWLWQGGQEVFGRTFALPRWLDVPLRSLKYVLLALFLYVVGQMSAAEIEGFLTSPYGLVADVKMMDFFRSPGRLTIGVCSGLVILSVLSKNVWCRYLCPYGALMGLASFVGVTRITRDPVACIDCGKCTKACPSRIPVDRLQTVRTPECTGCLSCVAACPVRDALDLRTVPARRRVSPAVVAAGVTAVFLIVVTYARITGGWDHGLPEHAFYQLVPRAAAFSHP